MLRGAALTRQLLAFSRRQTSRPRLFALAEVVVGMESMLRRLIGPEIEFDIVCLAEAVVVMADPAQIEQVVLNLVINARDAMPHGGRLTVRVETIALDETPVRVVTSAGSVEIAHTGEPQALLGSQTTLSVLTGLSFDTVLFQRQR